MQKILASLFLAASLWGYGEGVTYWAPHGCETGKKTSHGSHGRGEKTMLSAMNQDGNGSVRLILPDLSTRPLVLEQNTLTLPKPTMGGYYALVLEERTDTQISSAVRYLSQNGRPAKISPTLLTALGKTDLEIVPSPLHREHDRYTASKEYRFIIRFLDQPLGNMPVTLETLNGTVQAYTSDANGEIVITLPNDFTDVKIGRGQNKPSEFLLYTRHADGAMGYESALSMPYSPNPNDYWQSQELGAGAILIGFLGGMLLYRRFKGANNG